MSIAVRKAANIVIWSGITNLVLMSCFVAGWNHSALTPRGAGATRIATASLGPVSFDQLLLRGRVDDEPSARGPQRQLKGPLQLTMLSPAVEPPPGPAPAGEWPEADVAADGTDAPGGTEGSTAPVLRRSLRTGEAEIGSFTTVTMNGGASQCLDMGYSLLGDAGVSRDRLQVLAKTRAIVMARICAANGSVVISCRSDQITISPRRPKPGDGCRT